jgi:D-xylose 1-dehydrogenase (NADP+, D-xylono-1,5-lactone-forming)
MTDRPALRWGILSAARITSDLIPGLQRSHVNELVAIASRAAEKARTAASQYQIPHAVGGYDELLGREDIDCVYIPLPNHLHGPWTRRALEAGKHVLCEKPFVSDPDTAAELFALAESRGLHLAEAFMYRHHPKTHALKKIAAGGDLGAIHTIRSWFTYPADDITTDIRFNPAMEGGALRDVGCYPVSMINYLLDDEPETVSAAALRSADGVDERFYAIMRYRNGTVATLDCSMRSDSGYGVTVVGEAGTATVACPWYSHKPPHDVQLATRIAGSHTVAVSDENAYYLQTENFAAVVGGDATAEISGPETIRTARTLAALHAASL